MFFGASLLRALFPYLVATFHHTQQNGTGERKIFCLLQDVGHAIIESYSRVMESLAFNTLARIDDLLYVDDATKQRATAESTSLLEQGRFGTAPSKQKRVSPSRFSFQHSPFASPLRMPTFDSSSEVPRVPNGRTHHSTKKSKLRDSLNQTLEKLTF